VLKRDVNVTPTNCLKVLCQHQLRGKFQQGEMYVGCAGTQMDSMAAGDDVVTGRTASQCLVAIGRLQVTSSPNSNDLLGTNANSNEFISRHSIDGKFTFVDQRYVLLTLP